MNISFATTTGPSWPDNWGVLNIPQSSSITEASRSNFMSYLASVSLVEKLMITDFF